MAVKTTTQKEPAMVRGAFLSLLAVGVLAGTLGAAPPLRHVDVYVSGQDGYTGYRIPALEVTPDGTLLAFAEARKNSLSDPGGKKQDIDLVLKRSTDGGATWSAMTVVEDAGENWSAANPATVVDRQTGRVWVLYLRSKPGCGSLTSRPGTDDMMTFARWSEDNGQTWSEPIDLTAVARDMADPQWRSTVIGPGGMIQDRKGRLIAAAWRVLPWGVFTIYSEDHGRTWQRGEIVPRDGLPENHSPNETQVVELSDGRILMDYRDEKTAHRWMAESRDGGRTWTKPRPGNRVTPVACAIERYTQKSAGDDRDRIVWTGPKGPKRQNLVVRVSYDEGQTFPEERLIAAEPAAYSDLAILKDKSVGVLWERGNYKQITFTRLAREFLE
jgi:sialidase-1